MFSFANNYAAYLCNMGPTVSATLRILTCSILSNLAMLLTHAHTMQHGTANHNLQQNYFDSACQTFCTVSVQSIKKQCLTICVVMGQVGIGHNSKWVGHVPTGLPVAVPLACVRDSIRLAPFMPCITLISFPNGHRLECSSYMKNFFDEIADMLCPLYLLIDLLAEYQ